jgi:preprotein translocase subunit SecG
MIAAVYAIYIVICLALIVVVLLQSGKGAGLGAAFGGASQTVFGSAGRASFLTKTTAALAGVFMLISIVLAWSSSRQFSGGVMKGYEEPAQTQEMPSGALPSPGAGQPMTLPGAASGEGGFQSTAEPVDSEAEPAETQDKVPVMPTLPEPSQ